MRASWSDEERKMSGKVNLVRWAPHLLAAKREGVTLARYARSRGLSPYTLYAARQTLRRTGEWPATAERTPRSPGGIGKSLPASAFASVKVSVADTALIAPAPRLQARLPNGVMLELNWGGTDSALAVAIRALAGRR
jgi:hypothetical protein